jgi:acyl carrier protein
MTRIAPITSTGRPPDRTSHVSTLEDTTLTTALTTFIDEEVSAGHERVRPDTDLVMTGLVDSLGVVLIVEWLEDELAIEIDPGDVIVEHFVSVTAMIEYLRARGDCDVD